MGIILELRMCDADRERFGGTEWVQLDVDKLLDTPASRLKLYERQTDYPIERALDQAGESMPAVATQTLVWLARKQSGQNRNTSSGEAESFSALDDLKTMRVSIRRAAAEPVAEAEGDDADPPGLTPPTPEGSSEAG